MGQIITDKDRRILSEMSIHARMSVSELARRVRLSKQLISYRIKRMEKLGIIEGYHAIVDPYRLGRTRYRIFAKYRNMTREKEEELIAYLTEKPQISWIAQFGGNLDVGFLTWSKNINEFEKILQEIRERFGEHLTEETFSISTRTEYLKYSYLTRKSNAEYLTLGERREHNYPDETERIILEKLNKNARTSIFQLAQATGTSVKTARQKVEQLIKKGIIPGFNLKINHRLIGYTHRKIFLKIKNPTMETKERIATYLRMQPQTTRIVYSIGYYDMEFEAMTTNNEEFHNLIKELRRRFTNEIETYNTLIQYHEPKSGIIPF